MVKQNQCSKSSYYFTDKSKNQILFNIHLWLPVGNEVRFKQTTENQITSVLFFFIVYEIYTGPCDTDLKEK